MCRDNTRRTPSPGPQESPFTVSISLAHKAPGFSGLLTTSRAANRPRRRNPNTSPNHSIGRSDGRCVQRAGTPVIASNFRGLSGHSPSKKLAVEGYLHIAI
ncbi:hypothetical protein VNO78_37340 [Psophocarpus tetragonolobus]|uniref:Uncharacterized protein n=1 Tax=Psophocarpus tetragonolobus TaxID=3891 RepID=A0AAN9NCT5_PSOTE